ncbi:MAG: hypothetical protein JST48_08750 [Bacteroidetes bacterium]|nr:hypothetical protein [Bacteroidota bacterium]
MKKLSHKDLIIALGVLVAGVIIFSFIYFNSENTPIKSVKIVPEKKIRPAAILQKAVKKFSSSIFLSIYR